MMWSSSRKPKLTIDIWLINYRDFNNTVNMTADELEKWLKSDKSKDSGWSKSDGSGESVGHERQAVLFLNYVDY